MNLSLREKILMLTLALVIIVFGGIWFFVMPAMKTLSNDKASLSKLQVSDVDAASKIGQAQSMDTRVQTALKSATYTAEPLLPSLDKTSIHIFLVNLAEKNGLTIQSADFGDPTAVTAANIPQAGAAPTTGTDDLLNSAAAAAAGGSSAGSAAAGSLNYSMKTFADTYLGKAAANTKAPAGAGDAITSTAVLQVTGNYQQIEAFLDAVVNLKRTVVVTSFNCTGQETGSSVISLSFYAAEKLDNTDTIFNWVLPKPPGQKDLMP